ncbi:MAG: membrane dipeptidase [Victivallaceae bacterium]
MALVDLHCDLLSSPQEPLFSNQGVRSGIRCSPEQIRKGRICFQICAVFSETKKGSYKESFIQHELFRKLPEKTCGRMEIFDGSQQLSFERTLIKESIENASCLLEEDEPLDLLEDRLKFFLSNNGLAYVGLVWNSANRFGGGTLTKQGLTSDGKYLLDLLNHYRIPVDLSHACDSLVDDVLDYLNNKATRIQPLASHSNFREIVRVKRNLLTHHAKEIVRQGGVLGLNFVKRFLGKTFESGLFAHMDFAIQNDFISSICIGSDFFFSFPSEDKFFEDCNNSSHLINLDKLLTGSYGNFRDSVLSKTAFEFLSKTVAT